MVSHLRKMVSHPGQNGVPYSVPWWHNGVPSEPNSLMCPAGPSDCEVMPCLRLSWYPPYRGKINPPLSEISDEKATAFLGSLDDLPGGTPLHQHTALATLYAVIVDIHSACSLSWISPRWLGTDITKAWPAAPPIGPRCNSVFPLRGMCPE